MKLKLLFALLIVTISNAQTQIGQDIVGDMPDDKFGWGVALSADGNVMAVSAPGNDNNGTDAGHIRVYSKTSGTWTQIGQDIKGDIADDQIGYKIALSDDGSTVAFSAPFLYRMINSIGRKGKVFVYKNINGTWTQLGSDIHEEFPNNFGTNISLSADGKTIAVAEMDFSSSNGIWIYKFDGVNWNKTGEFIGHYIANDIQLASSGHFGWNISLSADGSILAISDKGGYDVNNQLSNKKGWVVVYKLQFGNWVRIGNPILPKNNYDELGHRVVLSRDGSILAISVINSSISLPSHVEVFKYINNTWTQIGNDIFETVKDYFGHGLSISENGNILAIGITGADTSNGTDTGKVSVFQNVQGNWVEQGSVIGQNAGDEIGWSIALSKDGHNLAIGNAGRNDSYGKPAINIIKNQVNNYQSKGGTVGSVQVYDISGILSSDTFVLENFNIYPNPTTDVLNIELKESLTLEKVLIYNTSGQLVKETSEKTINVSGLAKGIYNVQVLTNHGKATKKVIVK